MSDSAQLIVRNTAGEKVCGAGVVEGDVRFEDPSVRWTWVLDARHAPYDSLPLAEVLHRAEHARKKFALVPADKT